MEDIGQNGNGKENEKQPIKPPPGNNNNPHQPPPSQPPQQCPRCNSINTKFCYYNNYSLSQPRYFCKSCRRYWTHGGTLRNVPVGGGCRKGAKRLVKIAQASGGGAFCSSSSIGECSRSVQEQLPPPPLPPPQPPQPTLLLPQMRGFSNMGLPFANSIYTPSGILSSFTTMQNLNRPLGFNQVPLNGGGGGGGVGNIPDGTSSNYSVLQGFAGNPTMIRASQVVQQQIYGSQDAQMMINTNPNRPLGGSWAQGFINNPSSSNSTNVSWAQSMLLQPNNNISGLDAAMNNPNQWPDDDGEDERLPGYGPPPPSS